MKAKVLAALQHVRQFHPKVVMARFDKDGYWMYMHESGYAPCFKNGIDADILDEASNAAYMDKGFPCTYHIDDFASETQPSK